MQLFIVGNNLFMHRCNIIESSIFYDGVCNIFGKQVQLNVMGHGSARAKFSKKSGTTVSPFSRIFLYMKSTAILAHTLVLSYALNASHAHVEDFENPDKQFVNGA